MINLLYPEKGCAWKGSSFFFVSLIVSEVLVLVDIIFKELHNRSSFLLQPLSFPIEIHMKHECY